MSYIITRGGKNRDADLQVRTLDALCFAGTTRLFETKDEWGNPLTVFEVAEGRDAQSQADRFFTGLFGAVAVADVDALRETLTDWQHPF